MKNKGYYKEQIEKLFIDNSTPEISEKKILNECLKQQYYSSIKDNLVNDSYYEYFYEEMQKDILITVTDKEFKKIYDSEAMINSNTFIVNSTKIEWVSAIENDYIVYAIKDYSKPKKDSWTKDKPYNINAID